MIKMDKFKDLVEIQHLHRMAEDEIDEYAGCLARAFQGYSLFEYFAEGHYDLKEMQHFWEVSLRTAYKDILCMSNDGDPEAVALFSPSDYKDAGFFEYMKAGGGKLIFEFGPITVAKMLAFEDFAGKIKEKYTNENCWYLYSFAVDHNYQGKGYGSMLLKPMLAYLDRVGHDCYLETLKDTNVDLYEHYGFELMESTPVPGTDMMLYAMLRKPKK
jgi:GNAT superfamily N-acetyltransferase